MKPFLNKAHHKYSNDNRDYMSLIADHVNFVQPKPHALGLLYALGCHRPGILQIWMNHQHTDNRPKVRVAAKYLCRTECNKNRQECICSISKEICKYKDGAGSVNIQESVVYHEIQGFHDTHEKSAGYNGRNDRNENVAQCLDGLFVPRLFCRCRCFCFLGACSCQTGDA